MKRKEKKFALAYQPSTNIHYLLLLLLAHRLSSSSISISFCTQIASRDLEMAWLTRFLTAVVFLAIGVVFSPETFGSNSKTFNAPKLSMYLKLAHLLSYSTAWGASLWVTFIGGIIMFK